MDGRWYRHPLDEQAEDPVYSVTSILQFLAKPGLQFWAARAAGEWMFDNLDIAPMLGRDRAISTAANRHVSLMNAAGDLGTKVHELIDAAIEIRDAPTETVGFLAACASAMQDLGRVHATEATVFGERYAGTVDVICEIEPDVYAVVDWKTGSRMYETHDLQLAAYAAATEMVTYDRGLELKPRCELGVIIRLMADGTYERRDIEAKELERGYAAFESLREVAYWSIDKHERESSNESQSTGSVSLPT